MSAFSRLAQKLDMHTVSTEECTSQIVEIKCVLPKMVLRSQATRRSEDFYPDCVPGIAQAQ